ncbi:MAG: hypothetical protein R3D80_14310 [Paracoccaceae bacterium]
MPDAVLDKVFAVMALAPRRVSGADKKRPGRGCGSM